MQPGCRHSSTKPSPQHGRLDIIFNNAGIAVGGDALELTLAHWDRIIDINLRGVVHGVQAAYPVMAKQRSGHIVNTASMAGLIRAGVHGALRHREARRRRNVDVVA